MLLKATVVPVMIPGELLVISNVLYYRYTSMYLLILFLLVLVL